MDNVIRNILEFQERGLADLERANRALQDVSSTSRWTAFTSSITAANAAMSLFTPVVGAAQGAVEKMIQSGLRVEATRLTWKGLLGDMDSARARMQEINSFAANAPFTKLGIEAAAIQMQALNKYSKEALTAMGNLAAAFPGRTIEEATQAALGATRMEFDPLEKFGIGKAQIAQEIGIAAEDVHAETAKQIEQIWDATIAIIQRKHGTMMAELMNSTQGQITNLQDAMGRAWEQMGAGVLGPTKTGVGLVLDQMNAMLADGTFKRIGEDIGGVLNDALKGLRGFMEYVSGDAQARGIAKDAIDEARRGGVGAKGPLGYWDQMGAQIYRELGIPLSAAGREYYGPGAKPGMGDLRLAEYYGGLGMLPPVYGPQLPPGGLPPAPGSAGAASSGSALGGRAIPAADYWGRLPESAYWDMGYGPMNNPTVPKRGMSAVQGPENDPKTRGLLLPTDLTREQIKANHDFEIEDKRRVHNEAIKGMLEYQRQYESSQRFVQTVSQASSKVITGLLLKEHVERLKGVDIAKYVATQAAGASIQMLGDELKAKADLKAKEQVAEALGSFPNLFLVGKHMAAAAAWGALGGAVGSIGSSVLGGSQDSYDRKLAGTYADDSDPMSASTKQRRATANGVRALNAAAGPTNLTINIMTTYQGAVVFGEGGTNEWYHRVIVPMIRESFAMGELGTA